MKITRRDMLAASAMAGLAAAPIPAALAAPERRSGGGNPTKPVRIAVMQFMHENVTFLPFDTVLDDFIYEGSPARGEALLGSDPKGYIGGFVKVAREHANVEVLGMESPLFPKRGSGTGWVTKDAFETLLDKMIADMKAQGPFDGAYLALHGAMSVRGVDRAESVIARRVREVLGPKGFIAGTFDPHGNEDAEFFRYADFAFCIKYYPHYDGYLQGERAARMLIRACRGDYKPTTATRKPPILTASVLQWTGRSPWMDLVQRALIWEAREPDVYVNFYYGFAFADAVDAGMCFQVMTNGKPELANHIADDMANTAWRLRDQLVNGTKVYYMKDAVKLAKEALGKGQTPIVFADHSDRTGAATWLLEQIVTQKMSNTLIASIADADAIEALRKKGVKPGDPFDMEIGGRLDESAGKPVRITGTVNTVSGGVTQSFNKAAGGQLWVSVKFGDGNVVIISPYLYQDLEPTEFLSIGINPADFKAFAIKSRVHFRRGYDDNGYAKTILLCEPEQPFVGTVHLEALPYKTLKLDKFYPYGKNVSYP
ncbi:MAG: M81 family metallopeptidase [Solimonas sp.]